MAKCGQCGAYPAPAISSIFLVKAASFRSRSSAATCSSCLVKKPQNYTENCSIIKASKIKLNPRPAIILKKQPGFKGQRIIMQLFLKIQERIDHQFEFSFLCSERECCSPRLTLSEEKQVCRASAVRPGDLRQDEYTLNPFATIVQKNCRENMRQQGMKQLGQSQEKI